MLLTCRAFRNKNLFTRGFTSSTLLKPKQDLLMVYIVNRFNFKNKNKCVFTSFLGCKTSIQQAFRKKLYCFFSYFSMFSAYCIKISKKQENMLKTQTQYFGSKHNILNWNLILAWCTFNIIWWEHQLDAPHS